MKSFMIGRLVCMPEIQLSNWNPTRTVGDILTSIRRVLTAHGEVDNSEPEVNDPDSELQPYTAIEFELLRLTMVGRTPNNEQLTEAGGARPDRPARCCCIHRDQQRQQGP